MLLQLHQLVGALMKPALRVMSRSRLPQVSGHRYLEGLHQKVIVRRDRWGIPHIRAAGRHDLMLALGFVHAQDRLWQMELNRRAANGELSALLGPETLEVDRLTRTLGFARLACTVWNKTSETVREDLHAYTKGVNAYLDGCVKLPLEFSFLGYRPQPWRPLDSVAYARLFAWSLSHGWLGELTRAQLMERLGAELAAEIEPRYPAHNPLTLPRGVEFNQLVPDRMLNAVSGPPINRGLDGAGQGSNGWLISAGRSATGHAILANDVHLIATCPSLWYLVHLHCDGDSAEASLHVAGASQAGLPYVLLGHNERIAWGATVSYADCGDLFVEKLETTGPICYHFGGKRREAQVFEEIIAVKGQPDHRERVIVTHHGPLISDILPHNGQALALNAVSLRPFEAFDGFAQLSRASNWHEFVLAVGQIETPSLNFVYADVEDNIGYYLSGKIPVRAKGTGLVPAPGWNGEYEWVGYVPFEEMPHALNPVQGYIVTANQRIVNDAYPHFLGSLWNNGYRAQRIEELIRSQNTITPEDCARFQMDVQCRPGLELVRRLDSLQPTEADAGLSLCLLRSWDGKLDPASIGGTVYHVFLHRLSRAILEPKLGEELTTKLLGGGPLPVLLPISEFHSQWMPTLLRLLDAGRTSWLPSGSGREALLIRCLTETTVELNRLLGDDPSQWHWGKLHRVQFSHLFSARTFLDPIFGQGPFPIGGDTNTVCQTACAPGEGYENGAMTPSYRQIVDLGNLATSSAMFAPGQSGQIASPHYGDLIQPWLNGEVLTMNWEEEDIDRDVRHRLSLIPSLK